MGHYLSDMLPDPTVVCLNCREGVWDKETVQAWSGFLKTCHCANPDHCNVKDVKVIYNGDNTLEWTRLIKEN